MDVLKEWAGLFAVLIAVGTTLFSWFTAGGRNAMAALAKYRDHQDERDEQVQHKLAEHDRRIQAAEAELKHLPDKDSVMELKLSLADLKGTVSTVTESLGSISRTVHRIDDYLRDRSK
jgi:flagellar biosynthesis/type III secretory pathway M-ring protein FliF/YscJ